MVSGVVCVTAVLGVEDSVVGSYDDIFSLSLLFSALESKLLDDTVFWVESYVLKLLTKRAAVLFFVLETVGTP